VHRAAKFCRRTATTSLPASLAQPLPGPACDGRRGASRASVAGAAPPMAGCYGTCQKGSSGSPIALDAMENSTRYPQWKLAPAGCR